MLRTTVDFFVTKDLNTSLEGGIVAKSDSGRVGPSPASSANSIKL
ncbi:MAG: hypothetical protein RMJ56_08700 [Gemmataceae bacterium]|nr:hypothetical protein [Gemmata sp.]MDW8197665.1 hypothetical protein [Gemmataceae bacterium]